MAQKQSARALAAERKQRAAARQQHRELLRAARSVVPLMAQPYTVDHSPGKPAAVDAVNGYAWADVAGRVIHAPDKMSRKDMAHEYGHLFDYNSLNDEDRARFVREVHAPKSKWYESDGSQLHTSPAEWFADYYAAAAVGARPWNRKVNKDGSITGAGVGQSAQGTYAAIGPKRMRRFKALLDEIGRREHLTVGLFKPQR